MSIRTYNTVARKMASTRHTLGILFGYGWSMARVWLEYAYTMARVCLGANILFPGWEQNIPTLGTKHSQLGNKTGLRLALDEITARHSRDYGSCPSRLRLVVLMLLMLVVGVGGVKGQSLPFEVTTDDDKTNHTEKLYWIENAGATGFYAVPHSNNTNASTTNAPTLRALWFFMASGEDGYYYIINKETGKYLKKTGNAGNDNTIGVADYATADDVKFKFSFGTPEGITEGCWVIYPKDNSGNNNTGWLSKKSGNLVYNYWLKASTWNNTPVGDLNSQWKIVPRANIQWPQSGLPFVVSTNSDKHYYNINNAQSTTFNVSYDDNNNVTISNVDDEKKVWYFVEAASDPNINNLKYYYIVNASSEKYLKFTATTIDGSNQNDKFILSDYVAEDADRIQFVIVNSYAAGNPGYSIMPKLAMSKYDVSNNANSMVPASVGNDEKLDLRTDRNNNDAHWTFKALWGDPVVTCDETGTITITGEDGAAFYYTTDGSTVPTTGSTQYDASNKPTVSEGITTIKVRAIATGKIDSRVITQKIVYVPGQTFDSSTYDGTVHYNNTTQVPVVQVGETTISSDEYNVSYKLGGTDVTECKDAGTYTVAITDKDGGVYFVCGSGSFTISPKALTVTAEAKSKTYGDPDPELTYTSEGLVEGDAITGAQSRAEGEIVGTYAINQGDLSAGSNYVISSYTSANLTITQKALTITANSDTKEYNGTALTNNGYTHTDLATGDVIESVTVTGSQTNRGSSANVPSDAHIKKGDIDVTGCYAITYVNGTLWVTGRLITITAGSDTKVYDGTALTKNSYTYDGTFFSGDAIASVTVTGSQTTVGSSDNVPSNAVIKNGDTDVTSNYDFIYVNGTLEVTKKALTITADSDAKEYDGTALTKVTYSNTDLVTGDAIESVTVTGSQTVVGTSNNVPSAAVIKNDSGNGDDVTGCYDITYTNGTLTVTEKALTITAASDSKEYDGSALTNDDYTKTDLASGDAIESVTVTGSQTAVGTSNNVPSAAVIRNAGSEDVSASYAITYVNGTLEVTPKSIDAASITVTIDKDENGYIITVKDGETTLVPKPDTGDVYDYTTTVDLSNPNYYKAIITGNNNYTSEVTVRYALTNFMNDGDQGTEWSCTFVAEENHALPTGIEAYTVNTINGNEVEVFGPLPYIPTNEPILLLSDADYNGFRVEDPASVTDISAWTGDNNKLKVVNASTPNYDSDSGSEHYKSAHFSLATIYLLYRDEFVLNKDGYLAEGKVYLPVPSSGAGARLRINRASSTGINGIQEDNSNRILEDRWYTLDGLRLNGKPTKKGLYLKEGKKVVIK